MPIATMIPPFREYLEFR